LTNIKKRGKEKKMLAQVSECFQDTRQVIHNLHSPSQTKKTCIEREESVRGKKNPYQMDKFVCFVFFYWPGLNCTPIGDLASVYPKTSVCVCVCVRVCVCEIQPFSLFFSFFLFYVWGKGGGEGVEWVREFK
jgi:hypothetical protein